MKTPIFVRSFSEEEGEALQAGLRSKDAFTLRRCQMLLASSRGEHAPKIAESLGCGQQTVRDAIHDFNERGVDALLARSSRPKRTRDAFDEESAEALKEMLHRSPREFGYDTSLWTLGMAAEAAFEEGLTQRRVSGETIRATLSRLLGVRWMRAPSAGSPPPILCTKERRAARPTDGSGRGQPRNLGGGFLGRELVESGGPAHFEQLERGRQAASPPPALGRHERSRAEGHLLLRTLPATDRRHVAALRSDGRPISSITTQFLEWSLEKLEEIGKKVVVLIWDNASWHVSREVRRWLGKHNRRVKESERGVRIVSCLLPKQSPWLNAIEPKWVHGKRKVVEFDGLLGAYELADRVCGAFGCPHYEHLSIPQEVA